MQIILQKIIASSGYCSRRTAELLIRQGLVEVNDQLAVVGETADPDKDKIIVRGKLIGQEVKKIYLKLNKPLGYTCTNKKFPGEKNIYDLLDISDRLFAVGRLDKNSHGLIVLTNDGELTQKLAHPKYNHEKVYKVKIRKLVDEADKIIKKLGAGVDIGEGEGQVRVKRAQYLQNQTFIITLNEGKKRQIRRMFGALGMDVFDLERISFAGLELGDLNDGQFKYLSSEEIKKIKI